MKANFVSLLVTLLCMSFSSLAAPTTQSQSQHVAIPLKLQTVASQNQHGKRGYHDVQIFDYNARLLNYVKIGDQSICLVFDTGSSELNLDASYYTPGPDAINTNKTINLSYGQGNEADAAQVYLDTVKLGPTTTYNVPILHSSQNWFHDGDDCAKGLFGLSFPSMDQIDKNISTFLEQYSEQNPSQPHQFATWIGNVAAPGYEANDIEAMLYVGGYDDSKFSGSLTYTDVVVPEVGWWQIPSGGRINAQEVPLIIDSGTTYIFAPTLDDLYEFASGLNFNVTVGSQYASIPVPCSAEQVTVSFNDLTRKIPHLKDDQDNCKLPVQSYTNNHPTATGEIWIFGLPVYEQFFIVHDYENNRAGFALPT